VQRAGGEALLPLSRGELGDACGGVLTDALEDVDKVRVDVNAM
jgi:hypothetical protein